MILAVRRSDSAIQRVYARNRLDLSAIQRVSARDRHNQFAKSARSIHYSKSIRAKSARSIHYTASIYAKSARSIHYTESVRAKSARSIRYVGGSIRSNRRVPTWSHVSCLNGSKSQSLKSQRRGKTRQDMTMTWQDVANKAGQGKSYRISHQLARVIAWRGHSG